MIAIITLRKICDNKILYHEKSSVIRLMLKGVLVLYGKVCRKKYYRCTDKFMHANQRNSFNTSCSRPQLFGIKGSACLFVLFRCSISVIS